MTKRYVTPAEIRFLQAVKANDGWCHRPVLELCWYAGSHLAREAIGQSCFRKNFLQRKGRYLGPGDGSLYIITILGYDVLNTDLDELNATPQP